MYGIHFIVTCLALQWKEDVANNGLNPSGIAPAYKLCSLSAHSLCIKCTVMPPKVYMSSVCIVRPPIVYGIFPPSAVEQTLKFCQRRPVALFEAATSQKSLADPPVTPWICIEYSTIENTLQIHWQISHFSFNPPQIAPLMDRWFKCFTDYVVCPLCCLVGWKWPYFPQVYFKDGIPEILPPGKAQVAPRHSGQEAPKDLLLHGV